MRAKPGKVTSVINSDEHARMEDYNLPFARVSVDPDMQLYGIALIYEPIYRFDAIVHFVFNTRFIKSCDAE